MMSIKENYCICCHVYISSFSRHRSEKFYLTDTCTACGDYVSLCIGYRVIMSFLQKEEGMMLGSCVNQVYSKN